MKKILKRFNEDSLIYAIISGILLLSIGIYLLKPIGSIGRIFIITGSSLIYIATIILAFKI